ncbi:protein ycaC [Metarhizium guizhouense ARSEF 977]|uniref:Protein ycaC n=1 Tax=Metarhizium guizhouense (strain ARSEF 977) TaxID=1276136 RepID=A0A0B4HNW5_METGA|nr:protein ycaC [Metarhizium guizhouense ARSEF 977]
MVAHAAIGKLFDDLPVIMTTSVQNSSYGPLPDEILDMYPNATIIKRNGEVDAWDNPDFRKAIKATGRKQVILAGIVTDVCTTFLALSLRAEGYSVWANVEASGTTTTLLREVSNMRMQAAGVQLVGLFSIVADLFRDWRNPIGADRAVAWLNKYSPGYTVAGRAFIPSK